MENKTNTYINKIQECAKLVESIKTKTMFIQQHNIKSCEDTATPSLSDMDREIGYLLNNLVELNSSIIV